VKIALCNEVLVSMPFARQCEFAASVGYDGLELAPFTFSDEPHLMIPQERAAIRQAAEAAGLAITGLHWLLLAPKGLSITSADDAVRVRTVDVMRRLIGLCADLGGKVLVHGSPGQRLIPPGESRETALARARDCFAAAGEEAERAGVVYCIEPLAAARRPSSTPSPRPRRSWIRSAALRCGRWSIPAPPRRAKRNRSPPSSTAGCRPGASPTCR
jgi:sugar phosphate isomerase/epimerase